VYNSVFLLVAYLVANSWRCSDCGLWKGFRIGCLILNVSFQFQPTHETVLFSKCFFFILIPIFLKFIHISDLICVLELNKINTFYSEKLAEATRKFNTLKNELTTAQEPSHKSEVRYWTRQNLALVTVCWCWVFQTIWVRGICGTLRPFSGETFSRTILRKKDILKRAYLGCSIDTCC